MEKRTQNQTQRNEMIEKHTKRRGKNLRKRQACLFEKCMRREIMVNYYCTKNANGQVFYVERHYKELIHLIASQMIYASVLFFSIFMSVPV